MEFRLGFLQDSQCVFVYGAEQLTDGASKDKRTHGEHNSQLPLSFHYIFYFLFCSTRQGHVKTGELVFAVPRSPVQRFKEFSREFAEKSAACELRKNRTDLPACSLTFLVKNLIQYVKLQPNPISLRSLVSMGGHSTAINGRLRPVVPLQTQMSTYAFRKISNLAKCCCSFNLSEGRTSCLQTL